MGNEFSNLSIRLESSVSHLSRAVCCHLSGTIKTGVMLTGGKDVLICKDHVYFGKCDYAHKKMVEQMKKDYSRSGILGFKMPGNIAPYFFYRKGLFEDSGTVVYEYGHFFKYNEWTRQLDYDWGEPLEEPDDAEIFALLYPRFA